VFFRVTLPLAWRGILAGVLLGFARALGEFGATLMVAGSIPGKTQTLSVAVYEAVQAGRTTCQPAGAHHLHGVYRGAAGGWPPGARAHR
jgi:ABC-type molybdate transport system permease subunit